MLLIQQLIRASSFGFAYECEIVKELPGQSRKVIRILPATNDGIAATVIASKPRSEDVAGRR
jgi:hypothetical protein